MFTSILPQNEDYPLPPPPPWFQAALTTVCILSILLPAGLIRLSSGGLIFSLMFYLLAWTRGVNSEPYIVTTSSMSLVFRWLDLIVIHKPEKDFWRTGEVGGEKNKGEGYSPKDSWGKLKWFFDLWNSVRGIGWNIEPANLLSLPKDYPKALFIKQTLKRLSRIYLSLDILQNIVRYTYAAHPEPFFAIPLHIQLFITWVTALKVYNDIELVYSIGALITVIPGVCKPADWPPISGSFRQDAWSVRKMWGSCWHQLMRRPCSEAGRIVKNIFGFKKGSFMSRYSQIWIAFMVSSASHHPGAIVGCFGDGGRYQALYFMVQPVGIMMEDGVIGLGKKMGVKKSVWTKRLGFLWVFLWFTFWIRYMIAYQPRAWVENFSIPSVVEYMSTIVTKH